MNHIKNFNTYILEALGINNDLEHQADEIFKEISQSNEIEFEFPFYHNSSNHFFKLKIKDLGPRKYGHFIAKTNYLNGTEATITLSNRKDRSTLLHELKHLDRYLYKRKEDILKDPLDILYDDNKVLSTEKQIFYVYNTDEFEAKYHSYYININEYIKSEIDKYKSAKKDKLLIKHLIDMYFLSCEDKSFNWWDNVDFKFSYYLKPKEINDLFYTLTKKEDEYEDEDRDYFYAITDVINKMKDFLRKSLNIGYSKSEKLEMEKLKNKYEKEISRRKKIFYKKFRRIYTIMIEKWTSK